MTLIYSFSPPTLGCVPNTQPRICFSFCCVLSLSLSSFSFLRWVWHAMQRMFFGTLQRNSKYVLRVYCVVICFVMWCWSVWYTAYAILDAVYVVYAFITSSHKHANVHARANIRRQRLVWVTPHIKYGECATFGYFHIHIPYTLSWLLSKHQMHTENNGLNLC